MNLILKSVRLINFMCFKDSGEIPIHDMTVFIGENDCGKTTIFRALDVVLNSKIINLDEFYRVGGERANEVEIGLSFELDVGNVDQRIKPFVCGNLVRIKKVFSYEQENLNSQLLILKHVFENTLLNNVQKLKKDDLTTVCKDLGLEYKNVQESQDEISKHIAETFDALPKKDMEWEKLSWSDASTWLPLFELYSSSDYKDPKKLIEKTLKNVYRSFFYTTNEFGSESLLKEFSEKQAEIKKSLDEKIEEDLKEKVISSNPKIKSISGGYGIDFAGAFGLNTLLVDLGQGPNPIENVGTGTKKRLSLSVMEWDQEVRSAGDQRRTIRAYDEPDTSLHYIAQKHMFSILRDMSANKEMKVQTLICTHSIPMVDRAPPSKINHLVEKDGGITVKFFSGEDEADMKDFMNTVHEISGMKNSSLFFERCFLIVEGDTEEHALPMLYKKVCGGSFSEAGVVVSNLQNNAAWEPFLKLLGKYKQSATLLLLDQDIQEDSRKRVTVERLQQFGFRGDFLKTSVILAGEKEFEDMFSDDIIVRCLNTFWKKNEGELWTNDEIRNLRTQPKFSKALENLVEGYRGERVRTEGSNTRFKRFKKPEFGAGIAKVITKEELQAIPALSTLFSRIKGITQ